MAKPKKVTRRYPYSSSPMGAERKPTPMGNAQGRLAPPGPAKYHRKPSTWKQYEDYSYVPVKPVVKVKRRRNGKPVPNKRGR